MLNSILFKQRKRWLYGSPYLVSIVKSRILSDITGTISQEPSNRLNQTITESCLIVKQIVRYLYFHPFKMFCIVSDSVLFFHSLIIRSVFFFLYFNRKFRLDISGRKIQYNFLEKFGNSFLFVGSTESARITNMLSSAKFSLYM